MMSFLGKYKVKIILIAIIIVVTIFVTIISSPNSLFSKKYISKITQGVSYPVADVIDGDTFDIKVNNEIIRVRMLGMDTPETVDPRKPLQCYGKEASDKTKELLKGHFVALETDKSQSQTDKYGRILAYVRIDTGLFINEFLLQNGYAREYTYGTPYSKQKEFRKIQKDAKKNMVGLWGSCPI